MPINKLNKPFSRVCQCGATVYYKNKFTMDQAICENRRCKSCAAKGKNNSMYGKSLYDHWREKYGEEEADKRLTQYKQTHIGKHLHSKETISSITKNVIKHFNDNGQKSIYEYWVDNFGKARADQLMIERQKHFSDMFSGSNNPMYGKPSPQGSGNGWSGWYKGYFFRSILELSYLKYLIDNGVKFRTAETNEFRIKYTDWQGHERTYTPDFYLEDTQEVVEVKPKRLINTPSNKSKWIVAKNVYKDKFIIQTENDITKLTIKELKRLCDNGDIIWTKRYEEKFKERLQNETNYMYSQTII